jgi:AbrB family looped-hinge helix DNA binding protein
MELAVKVLSKGQITLPSEVRRRLKIAEGDTLTLEEKAGKITLKKGKSIFDLAGILPNLGIPIDEMIEKATEEAVKDMGR